MIRLGLRLTLNGGKEAAVRLVITSAAVALGVGLLLIALAGMNAINAQNARSAWLNTGSACPGPAGPGGAPPGPPGASRSPTRRTRCGGCPPPTTSGTTPSIGLTWRPPARTRPSRPACPTCPARDSSTPRPP